MLLFQLKIKHSFNLGEYLSTEQNFNSESDKSECVAAQQEHLNSARETLETLGKKLF